MHTAEIHLSIIHHNVFWIILNTSLSFNAQSHAPHEYHFSHPSSILYSFVGLHLVTMVKTRSMALTDPMTLHPQVCQTPLYCKIIVPCCPWFHCHSASSFSYASMTNVVRPNLVGLWIYLISLACSCVDISRRYMRCWPMSLRDVEPSRMTNTAHHCHRKLGTR